MQIGAVSYLNSRPLIEGLEGLLPSANLVLDYPSRLADALSNGQLDVALIPSIEYFRRPGYEVISDACVAARGEVLSVKLYCRVHPGQIRTLALDEGSRTSAALTKVILAERYGVIPKTEPLRMESTTTDSSADIFTLVLPLFRHRQLSQLAKKSRQGQGESDPCPKGPALTHFPTIPTGHFAPAVTGNARCWRLL